MRAAAPGPLGGRATATPALVTALVAGLLGIPRGASAHQAAPACLPVPAAAGTAPGPGAVDPFRPPAPEATALNAAAKSLYRQGQWAEARAKYHAAELADPDFLAPALNIACSFVRQERFDEATHEVIRLLDRAFVPWSREILVAADLGALKVQPQMAQVQRALADGARRWGAALDTDLLFVARQREPLKLPPAQDAAGPVVLVLGLHQEVFAWSPVTGRYRQITAEDGHVLAMVPSSDHRSVLYVTGEKLVRVPHARSALRGLTVHTLTLATLSPGTTLPLAGDVGRLAIAPLPAPGAFMLSIEGDQTNGTFSLTGAARDELLPAPAGRRLDERVHSHHLVVLTADGVVAAAVRELPPILAPAGGAPPTSPPNSPPGGACRLVARQLRSPEGVAIIEIADPRAKRDAPVRLRPHLGAGLAGLSIP